MFKKNKKGYTLVEMMVVLSMLAVLSIITVGGMRGANDENYAEEVAQGILTSVRDAQTRAVSISKDKGGNVTKVWSAVVQAGSGSSAYYRLRSYYLSNSGLTSLDSTYVEYTVTSRPGITITMNRISDNLNLGSSAYAYINYSTPFARPNIVYNLDGNFITANRSCPCCWAQSTRPEMDWSIADTCANTKIMRPSNEGILITVKYKNAKKVVRVYSDGDAYIQ